VRLKRLIVQGFKSFKDRTTIHFDDGITGIVGPNGCGKSNIVDALFWVMGEQSAKHLRGNTMKDVIFSGSSKYSPSTWAEVTLVLDNDAGKHIHINNTVCSPSEIQLTRKLYRNGETEYRINGEPCRLKDIHEVFMDTGAGAKSYSIIAQGEINRLVQAKPEERRTMIEEVAGITKFKIRKRDSLKKIEQTEQNLHRLSDLQIEIEKSLKSLEKQAEKAERARTLKDKVRRHDLIVHSHKEFDLLREYKDLSSTIIEKKSELENWALTKTSLELSLQEERIRKDDLSEEIDGKQKEFNERSKKLAAAEERLNSLCRSLTDKEKNIEARIKDIDETREELADRNQRKEKLIEAISDIEAEGQDEHDLGELQDKVALMRDDLDELESEIKEKRKELEVSMASFQQIDQTLFQNQSKQEEFSRTLQDLTQEIEIFENQYSGVSSEIRNERDIVNNLEQKVSQVTQQESEVKTDLKALQEQKKQNEVRFREMTKNKITIESRLHSLVEMNQSLEGREEGVQVAMDTIGQDSLAILGSLVKCDEKYTAGVQLALGHWLDRLVSLSGKEQGLLEWMGQQTDLKLDVLLEANNQEAAISDEAFERLKVSFGEGLLPLKEIVHFDEKISHFSSVLEGYYLCESLRIEEMQNFDGPKFKGIFQRDGAKGIRLSDGMKMVSLYGGEQEQGFVARNNMIQKLSEELSVIESEYVQLETQIQELSDVLNAKELEFERVREQLLEVNSTYASKKSALESKSSNMKSGQEKLEILKKRKADTSVLRLKLMEDEEDLLKEKTSFDSRKNDLSLVLEELQEQFELKNSQYTDIKDELREKQMQAQSYEQRLNSVKSQLEDVQSQIDRQTQRIEQAQRQVEEYQAQMDQINQDLTSLETENQEQASLLSDEEEDLNDIKEVLTQLLLQMQEREEQVKELTSNINRYEKEMAAAEARLGQIRIEEEQNVRNAFEKYQVQLRECLGRYLEYLESEYQGLHSLTGLNVMETETGPEEIAFADYEFTRRYGQDLKESDVKLRQYRAELSRLGDINWQAIEEYERQKLRFDFLRIQEVELKKSLENLQTAIAHIDEKSRERFKIAFEEVNTRFQKVFPIIFGGGSAQLKVTGDINDPECGVDIIAQPPGKNMQSINLMSGGEKAMTAVSLIFSIFLVKPSPFCLLDEVDAPLDDANVGRFNELLREMSKESQFILITHNKKTMELNDTLYGVTMQEPGVSKAVSVELH
jgi:chromosome segregation protein